MDKIVYKVSKKTNVKNEKIKILAGNKKKPQMPAQFVARISFFPEKYPIQKLNSPQSHISLHSWTTGLENIHFDGNQLHCCVFYRHNPGNFISNAEN